MQNEALKTPEALATEIADLFRALRLETEQDREAFFASTRDEARLPAHAIVTLAAHTEPSRD